MPREPASELTRTVTRLASIVGQLAKAQARTEDRLNRVGVAIEKLADAQKKTEDRLNRVEAAIERLAEAQKKTIEAVEKLSETIRGVTVSLGRLSDTIGFGLEDIARVVVPGWLERHEKILVRDLQRNYFSVEGKILAEVNLYAEGTRNGKAVIVVGEAKSRIYSSEAEAFARTINEIADQLRGKEVFKLMFGYLVHPSAREVAEKHGIKLIASYQR